MKHSDNMLKLIADNVTAALTEDVRDGDVTASLIDADLSSQAYVISRENAVLCGRAWFDETFTQCDPGCEINWALDDGENMQADQQICTITGNARAMVTGRTYSAQLSTNLIRYRHHNPKTCRGN